MRSSDSAFPRATGTQSPGISDHRTRLYSLVYLERSELTSCSSRGKKREIPHKVNDLSLASLHIS